MEKKSYHAKTEEKRLAKSTVAVFFSASASKPFGPQPKGEIAFLKKHKEIFAIPVTFHFDSFNDQQNALQKEPQYGFHGEHKINPRPAFEH